MKDIPNPKIKKRRNTFNLQTKPINKNDSRIKSKQIATKIQWNQKKNPNLKIQILPKRNHLIYIYTYICLSPTPRKRAKVGKKIWSSHLCPEKKKRRGEKRRYKTASDSDWHNGTRQIDDKRRRVAPSHFERERERERDEAREDRRIRREESVRYNTSICVRASVFPRCLAARADFARATLYRPWPGYDTNRWCWRSTETLPQAASLIVVPRVLILTGDLVNVFQRLPCFLFNSFSAKEGSIVKNVTLNEKREEDRGGL